MNLEESYLNSRILGSGYERKPDMNEIEEYHSSTTQGFLKLVLTGPTQLDALNLPDYSPFEAFGHKSFPVVYANKAFDLSKGIGDGLLPNQPYTPTLKTVTLDYSARETFIPFIPNGIDQFFLLDIFGIAEINKNETARLTPLIPLNGALYIGLENSTPPQTLSFLFQVETGNVPGEELLEYQDFNWSYLADNQWETIAPADVLEESTDAFQKPGIIRLNIGSNASSEASLMPSGLHWVRISVNRRADGAGAVQDVVAQAARATLVSNNHNYEMQLIQPGTISKLVSKVTAIKSVKQDYPSFNGLPPETDEGFFRRISERLRHRNRAVIPWDYERLVLEAFPGVFKVKCLQHTNQDNEISPGHIKLVVIPDLRFQKAGNPLQPRNNLSSLREIETFLKVKYLSPFVTLHAANPEYETLLVDCKVAFHPGFDPGFYSTQLQEDIRRFLSPWAYEEGQDIIFGGKIYKSEILAFIEGRPYVDFVIDFQLYHRFDGEGLPVGIGCMTIGIDFIVSNSPVSTIGSADGIIAGGTIGVDFVIGEPTEVAIATRPDAILVSNETHRIEVLQSGSFECSGVTSIGIGQMIVGLDFIPVS